MKCPRCGCENSEGQESCLECGIVLDRSADIRAKAAAYVSAEPTKLVDSSTDFGDDDDNDPPPHPVTIPGEILDGKYEIIAEIGHGGMGRVYSARDTKLGRNVAIKRLECDDEDGIWGIDRFHQEAKAIAALNHPNIVIIYELGRDSRGPYIVMELIEGHDMETRLEEDGALPFNNAVELIKTICSAIAFAHKKNVIHRDIKPSNVLITTDGVPKLVDFGLARMAGETDISRTGIGMGTLAYVAPEQMRDAKNVDQRCDIYSLGKTFYHLLTGEIPDAIDFEEVPNNVKHILRSCLKPKPEDRYFSVDDLLHDLSKIGTETSNAPASGPPKPGVCPECGRMNDLDARFCSFCSAPFFADCPGCGKELPATIRFCKYCSTDIPALRKVEKHLTASRKYMQKKRYAAVVRESQTILEIDENHEEAQALLSKAETAMKKLDNLKKAMETAINRSDTQQAQQLFREAEQLTDSSLWLGEEDGNLAKAVAEMDIQDAHKKFEEGFFGDALWSVRQAGKLGVEEAARLQEDIEDKKREYREKLSLANQAFLRGRFLEVPEILAQYQDKPGLEAAHDLILRSREASQTVTNALEDARRCHRDGDYEGGIRACEAALRVRKNDEQARTMMEDMERLRLDIETLLSQGDQHLTAQQFPGAIDTFREVEDMVKRKALPVVTRARRGIEDAEQALSALRESLKEARIRLAARDFTGGLEECERALGIQQHNEDAARLKEDLERGMMYERATRLAQKAFQSGQYAKAIELWSAILQADPDSKEAAEFIARSEGALRGRRAKRAAITATVVLAIAGACAAYLHVRGGNVLDEAKSFAASGMYAQAMELLEKVKTTGDLEEIESLAETWRFELALMDLERALIAAEWGALPDIIPFVRYGLTDDMDRMRVGEVLPSAGLSLEAMLLSEEGKLIESACIHVIMGLANGDPVHEETAYAQLVKKAEDLISKGDYQKALKLVERTPRILGGRQLEGIEKRARAAMSTGD